jgi:hypothetical protein
MRLLRSPKLRVAALFVILVGAGFVVGFFTTHKDARYDLEDFATSRVLSSQPEMRRSPEAGSLAMRGEVFDTVKTSPAFVQNDLLYSSAVPGSEAPAERHVERRATIELVTDDVAAAFLKCAQLLSESHGEYIESSSLSGSGDQAKGNLKLRVAASRLSAVLNDLRGLGTVRAEDSHGEDVTSQVVDIEARLRNEQRIEAELLELLDTRVEAPLTDVLKLRQRLNEVRESIERLVAQQQRLGRLVDLASVLVIIRAEDAPPEEPEAGLGAYFSRTLFASWTSGLRVLADTLAGAVGVIVGGLLWWALLAAALIGLRHHWRQRQAAIG